MILLNDARFSDEKFFRIKQKEEILDSPNNCTLMFEFGENCIENCRYCKMNGIEFGVEVKNIKELIFVSNLGAKYVFVDNLELAKEMQDIADDYLLLTKIIIKTSLNKIENVLKSRIDGIFVI